MDDKKKTEVKYQPRYYIDDLDILLGTLREKVKLLNEIDFDTRQRATIAGLMMGISDVFNSFVKKLTEWGYFSSQGGR